MEMWTIENIQPFKREVVVNIDVVVLRFFKAIWGAY
jgi:hypothetical protein